jgi:hypothetical protein
MTLTGFNVPYSSMCRSTSTVLIFFYPFHLTLPPMLVPSPKHDVFYSPVLHCLVSVQFSVGFCLGILPVNTLYFKQSNSLYHSSSNFSPYSSTVSVYFVVSCSYTNVMYLNMIHYQSFLILLLSLF